jgi:RNA recognition motif-containing protein
MVNIYVGNLPFGFGEEEVRQLFAEFGEVQRVSLITDRATGQSRGFGFVEMGDDTMAQAAIAALDGRDVDGRKLTVNVAKPKAAGGGGGGGGGRGGRGGGGGGGGRW